MGVIDSNTPIAIGLILTGVGFLVGGIWWAATMNSKMDMVLTFINSTTKTHDDLRASQARAEAKVDGLVTRVAVLESQRHAGGGE